MSKHVHLIVLHGLQSSSEMRRPGLGCLNKKALSRESRLGFESELNIEGRGVSQSGMPAMISALEG